MNNFNTEIVLRTYDNDIQEIQLKVPYQSALTKQMDLTICRHYHLDHAHNA